MLSNETLSQVAQIITTQALAIRESEIQKSVLVKQKGFVALNAFVRMDYQSKGYINTLDLVSYFHDNGLIVSESDCYMLVQLFDTNNDGKLSLVDLMLALCPRNYTYKKNFKNSKRFFEYAEDLKKLSYDIEYSIMKVLMAEIESTKQVELMKQDLVGRFDYSILSIFRYIDQFSHGKINIDNMRSFLKNFPCAAALDEDDITSWIRRYDKDIDGGLKFTDLCTALSCVMNYNKQPSPNEEEEVEQEHPQSHTAMSHPKQAHIEMASTTEDGQFNVVNSIVNQSDAIRGKSSFKENRALSGFTKTTKATSNVGNQLSVSQVLHDNNTEPGDMILNYPYSYDRELQNEINLQEHLYRSQSAQQQRVLESRAQSLFPSKNDFSCKKEFGETLIEMSEIEGDLDRKRRELALRQDFNICDAYKMFIQLQEGKKGIDCDDLFATIVHNLQLTVTKDEVFIIFYKLDRDGDGFLNYNEITDCFVPRQNEYAKLINSRGGFYGAETDTTKYFEGETRELIKKFIRGFIECEVSIELVRQRIMNKLMLKAQEAFKFIDVGDKGYLLIDDLRDFLKDQNLYPIEKNLTLLCERFDKDEDGVISYDDFVNGITPFLNAIQN